MKVAIFLGHPKFFDLMISIGDSLAQNGVIVEYLSESYILPKLLSRVKFSKRETDYAIHNDKVDFYKKNFCHLYGLEKGNISNRVKNKLKYMPNLREYSTVIFWNGLNSLEYEIAKIIGVRTFCLENGYIPNTLQIGVGGINALSHIRGKSSDDLTKILNDYTDFVKLLSYKEISVTRIRKYKKMIAGVERLFIFGAHGFLKILLFHLREYYYKYNQKKLIQNRDQFELKQFEAFKNQKNIFLAFQVHDDTQIFINSELRSSLDLVGKIKSYTDTFSGYSFFVKIHPKDIGRFNYEQVLNENKIPYFYSGSIEKYIDISEYIILINSSVGFQSLIKGKKVISFGRTLYNMTPGNLELSNKDSGLLEDFMSEGFDSMKTIQFTNLITKVAFIEGTWEGFSNKSISSICKNIFYYDQQA